MKKKIEKRIFRVYGARMMSGSKLSVALNKEKVYTDIEKARKEIYDKYFKAQNVDIKDIALTFCTETYYEKDRE